MARGRWSEDNEGWRSRRQRSSSRGGGRGGRKNENDAEKQLREAKQETQRLQQQVRELQRGAPRAGDALCRPSAKEGPDRDGDWQCAHCLFRTNRHSRTNCYRCAVAKAFSFKGGASVEPATCSGTLRTGTPISLYKAAPLVSNGSASLPPFIINHPPPIAAASPSPSITSATIATSSAPPSSSFPTSVPSSLATSTAVASTPNSVPGLPQSSSAGPEAAKALKGQLETLQQVKAKLVGDPLCGHIAEAIESQISGVRAQLASLQPLEVALRTTLVTVTQARAALQRAEAKASKLEAAVVAAVSTYEVAAAEVQSCQRQLAEAEAATARTAGGRFDPRLLLGDHPGAALAILQEAAANRCVVGLEGIDAAFAARVHAAFAEVQEVCRRLPAAVPQQQPPQPTAAAAPVPAPGGPAVDHDLHMGEGVDGANINPPQGHAGPAPAAAGATGPSGQEAAAAALAAQQILLEQQETPQLPSAVAARLHEQQAAQMAAQQQQQAILGQQSAAAAGLAHSPAEHQPTPNDGRSTGDKAAEPPAGGGSAAANAVALVAADGLVASEGSGDADRAIKDDAMGGGAADGMANKRSAAAASIETARAIAAKAKARAS